MEQADICKLFNLLEALYKGSKRPRDRATLTLWEDVLKPWSYGQVRDAAVRRARVNRYFPDPSELAEYLPQPEEPPVCPRSSPGQGDRAVEAMRAHWLAQRRWRIEAGVPAGLEEARRADMTAADWLEALDGNGLGLDGQEAVACMS